MIIFAHKIDADNKFDQANITMTIPNSEITLTDLLEEFERFLVAVGYSVGNGRHIDIVDDDEDAA